MSNTQVNYNLFFKSSINNLSTIKEECERCYKRICNEYIWHSESFQLQEGKYESTELLSLCGSTDVGENINDEWFIVYLLFEISKRFPECIIQVTDSDGDFLLIEAADELPSWLKPESSENRVFIHSGSLHIIPLPTNPAEITILPTGKPAYSNAYDLITSKIINTTAADKIQQCILKKIQCYPETMTSDIHHAHCYIPSEIIYILQTRPNIISKAVQAFYGRDPLDVKICQKMNVFKSENRLLCRVKFTKHLYSQLKQATFHPDPKSGWKLPTTGNKLYKASELGFKLTCGFEILASQVGKTATRDVNEPGGRYWEQYLISLKKNDYFQNELEGSKRYKELLEQAKEQFKNDFSSANEIKTSQIGKEILQMVEESKSYLDAIKKSTENILPEDNDDWMTITPEELDQMMLGKWSGNEPVEEQSENLNDLVSHMKSFVDQVSSYEGAEIPNSNNTNLGASSNNSANNVKGTDKLNNASNPKGIDTRSMGLRDRLNIEEIDMADEFNFDPREFVKALKEYLDPNDEHIPGVESDSDVDDDFISCKDDVKYNDDAMNDVIDQMDKELDGSSMSKSFKNKDADGDTNFDVDVNLVENFLDSVNSQEGWSGPVRNILQSMGINLPADEGT